MKLLEGPRLPFAGVSLSDAAGGIKHAVPAFRGEL